MARLVSSESRGNGGLWKQPPEHLRNHANMVFRQIWRLALEWTDGSGECSRWWSFQPQNCCDEFHTRRWPSQEGDAKKTKAQRIGSEQKLIFMTISKSVSSANELIMWIVWAALKDRHSRWSELKRSFLSSGWQISFRGAQAPSILRHNHFLWTTTLGGFMLLSTAPMPHTSQLTKFSQLKLHFKSIIQKMRSRFYYLI